MQACSPGGTNLEPICAGRGRCAVISRFCAAARRELRRVFDWRPCGCRRTVLLGGFPVNASPGVAAFHHAERAICRVHGRSLKVRRRRATLEGLDLGVAKLGGRKRSSRSGISDLPEFGRGARLSGSDVRPVMYGRERHIAASAKLPMSSRSAPAFISAADAVMTGHCHVMRKAVRPNGCQDLEETRFGLRLGKNLQAEFAGFGCRAAPCLKLPEVSPCADGCCCDLGTSAHERFRVRPTGRRPRVGRRERGSAAALRAVRLSHP